MGLPVPVLPTLIVGGALAAQGTISPAQLFAGAVIACLLADSAWFFAGRAYGNGVMKLLCRISLTPDSCVSETQSRFERWGANALIVAKFVPGLSLIAPPLAGATRMAWLRFLACCGGGGGGGGGGAWAGGFLSRRQTEPLWGGVAVFGLVVVVFLGVLLVLFVSYRGWERKIGRSHV